MKQWNCLEALGKKKKNIIKDKHGENIPHLESTEVALIHCNIVDNDYQLDSRLLNTFFSSKSFGQVLEISPPKLYFWSHLI